MPRYTIEQETANIRKQPRPDCYELIDTKPPRRVLAERLLYADAKKIAEALNEFASVREIA